MNQIVKDTFAPARVLMKDRLKQVMDARIHIANGAYARGGKMPPEKKLCIMEATAYILGYEKIDDSPPCTSYEIREFMITINDSDLISDRQRAKLKHVIPDIVNTAPTNVEEGVGYLPDGTFGKTWRLVVTDDEDPHYQAAEDERAAMISRFEWRKYSPTHKRTKSMREIIAFIRELADVAHFDGSVDPKDKEKRDAS